MQVPLFIWFESYVLKENINFSFSNITSITEDTKKWTTLNNTETVSIIHSPHNQSISLPLIQ